MKINKFTKALIKEFAEKGYKADFSENLAARQLDSLWYGGQIVRITDNKTGHFIDIFANGEVRVIYDDNKGHTDYMVDKNHCGDFASWVKQFGLRTDKQIHKAEWDRRLLFWNNNWFEVFYDDDTGYDVLECDINCVDAVLEYFEYYNN